MTEYISFTVRCQGCGELIERPSDAAWDWFRRGIHLHDKARCLGLFAGRAVESTVPPISMEWRDGE